MITINNTSIKIFVYTSWSPFSTIYFLKYSPNGNCQVKGRHFLLIHIVKLIYKGAVSLIV